MMREFSVRNIEAWGAGTKPVTSLLASLRGSRAWATASHRSWLACLRAPPWRGHSFIMPNNGYVPNLEQDVVIEVPGWIEDGVWRGCVRGRAIRARGSDGPARDRDPEAGRARRRGRLALARSTGAADRPCGSQRAGGGSVPRRDTRRPPPLPSGLLRLSRFVNDRRDDQCDHRRREAQPRQVDQDADRIEPRVVSFVRQG